MSAIAAWAAARIALADQGPVFARTAKLQRHALNRAWDRLSDAAAQDELQVRMALMDALDQVSELDFLNLQAHERKALLRDCRLDSLHAALSHEVEDHQWPGHG